MDREPIENIDFYRENGLVVFTAQYLRDRGYCCASGCRHCPYGFAEEPPAQSGEMPAKKKSGPEPAL